jgi:GR25 family glycosyltransferase involved in LPS biosynthesis
MLKQFEENKIDKDRVNFVKAISFKDLDKEEVPKRMSDKEHACTLSHIKAINLFLQTDKEYCFILEDDANIENSKKFSKPLIKIIKELGMHDIVIQLAINVREEDLISFKVKKRSFWDFSCAVYFIDRVAAKKIVSCYSDKDLIEKNFVPARQVDPRNSDTFFTRPTTEEIVLSYKNTVTLPVFTISDSESDIMHENHEESKKQVELSASKTNNSLEPIQSYDLSPHFLEIKKRC